MIRISRLLHSACHSTLLLVATPAVSEQGSGRPVLESTSSGLLTFSGEDKALRVAVVLVQQDEAVVPTLVRFIDARGGIVKQQRGELRNGQPLVAELMRRDVGARSDLLVRVEVLHKLPGLRDSRYPILVTTQPISLNGSARFVVAWNGGGCGCPTCGPPTGPGQHVDCEPEQPTDI
jgi:hypothetical protein